MIEMNRIAGYAIIFFCFWFLPNPDGSAHLYRWVDENGVKHFSNSQPEGRTEAIHRTEEYFQSEDRATPQQNGTTDQQLPRQIPSRSSPSGPRVTVRFEYYAVKGMNTRAIKAQMTQKTPIRYNGKKYRGNTNWRINYRFFTDQQDGLWSISKVTTTVDIIFTMPKWEDYAKADRNTRKEWNRYYHALLDHEYGHRDIVIDTAEAIEHELADMRNDMERIDLENSANARAKEMIEWCKERNRQFDLDTGHGDKTGAILR